MFFHCDAFRHWKREFWYFEPDSDINSLMEFVVPNFFIYSLILLLRSKVGMFGCRDVYYSITSEQLKKSVCKDIL